MSRCFPFSSTGFAGKSSINDSLIVSIKQQEETPISLPDRPKEMAKSSDVKKDRKRERKEKKEKKKEKKERKSIEKEKLHSAVQIKKQKLNDTLFKVDGFGKDASVKTTLEVLERSNLTEEHGRPVDPQNVSCSSDSTGNSGKRKRDPSPVSSIQGNGNIIRIRLSSQKRDDPSASKGRPSQPTVSQTVVIPKAQGPLRAPFVPTATQTAVIPKVQEPLRAPFVPIASQTTVIPKAQEPVRAPFVSTVAHHNVSQSKLLPPSISPVGVIPKVQEPVRAPVTSTFAHGKLLPPSVSRAPLIAKPTELLRPPTTNTALPPRDLPSTSGRAETKKPEVKKLSHHEKKMLKRETLYNSLFQNLVPPTMFSELVPVQDDDEDWLFGKKGGERPPKKLKESDDLPCSTAAAFQPRAHFLSDVGVYALPFTIPF